MRAKLEPVTDPPAAPRLLLVEDDRRLAGVLAELLTDEGYLVDLARDGQQGLHLGLSRQYDVIVVDRRLPAIEGLDLVRRLRGRGVTTGVLVLTARGTVADRVEGLDAGAEDYLTKPFDTAELLARLRALRRRHRERAGLLPVGRGWLDVATRQVRDRSGGVVALSDRECALLQTLAARPHQVFSRNDLRSLVFDAAESPGVVDTYVHYLRRKLGRPVIRTVHGLGYQIGAA
ncbi:response regulator transcription factor [Dactylosporangium sp. AC04546]|uniref:response regulator transcription factor n=1 Tax=Dactylosporangium sp. AC04546 TaxID=2862460 RepID=UPI001EDDC003|nr:response regulator transcription factor [Dactylosporangium sp. AC04546]WVK78690.1 response regulator transcription factor [Dactylosporangium sp. AC04546]